MKFHLRNLLAAVLALAMAFTLCACGGSPKPPSGGGGTAGTSGEAQPTGLRDFMTYETAGRDIATFFILNTEKSEDLQVLCNFYTGLLENDNRGQLVPAVAREWSSDDDGLTWTFRLRDDVTWVDVNGNEKARCTARDWITALEWVLNFQKNGGYNISMPCTLIAGARDYYDYTTDLSEEEGKALDTAKFLEMVGIEAPDDYTLIYHCTKNAPYFPTLCVSACLFPLSQGLIDELGVDSLLGMTNETMWYNGAYTCTSFVKDNEKVLTPNPAYWDKDCTRFDSVTIRIVDDGLADDALFQTGELDHCALNESTLRTIMQQGESHQYFNNLVETRPKKFSYQMHLNFAKNREDGTPDTNWNTAIANENFRLAWYYGLNLAPYWAYSNPISPQHCENLAYTMRGLLQFSDGTDYVDRVIAGLDIPEEPLTAGASRRYDPDRAADYKKKAMEELKAKGVTFPVEVDYYIVGGSQTAVDSANILRQVFAQGLGEDFVTFNLKTYVSSHSKEVVAPSLHSFALNGWGADYGDPENFLGQELYGEETAYYSTRYSNINDATDEDLIRASQEFTELARKAAAIVNDNDARYQAFVDAEICLLKHALVIPINYSVGWQLTKVNVYSSMYALYGINNNLYKNWETSEEIYTTEDYARFEEEYNSQGA